MKKTLSSYIISILLLIAGTASVSDGATTQIGSAQVRLKDLVRIQGCERIDLIGYGVVVGLNKTGDKDIELAKRTVSNLMKNFNIFIDPDDITSKKLRRGHADCRCESVSSQRGSD